MYRSSKIFKPINPSFLSARNRQILGVIVTIITIVFAGLLFNKIYTSAETPACPYVWHGGSPTHKGSCWCGNDDYCMCTPSLAIDAVIEHHNHGSENEISILLVFRRDPPKDLFAIPGGFVDVGEAAELALIREVKEETNLTVSHMEQFKLYSDPYRDKRRHTASMVFRTIVDSIDELHTGDDAKEVKWVNAKDVLNLNLAFDHKTILGEYLKRFHPKLLSE